jgi:raffinose/stachyose/melibiose transport system permease protein
MLKLYPKSSPWKFLALPLLVYTLVVLLPVIMTFMYSLTDWNITSKRDFTGFANYTRMFRDEYFMVALKNNVVYLVIDLACEIIIGLLLAIFLNEISRKFSTVIKMIYFIPCVISSIAIAETVKRMVTMVPKGVINALLESTGLGKFQGAFAAMPSTALQVVALADVYKWSGLYMVIYYSALISLSNDQIEAAIIDGANLVQTYTRIRLPMIRNIIVTTAILITTGTLKVFEMPFLLTKGGPGYSSQVLSTYMYLKSFDGLEFGYGSAISVFQAILSFFVLIILRFVIFRKSNLE